MAKDKIATKNKSKLPATSASELGPARMVYTSEGGVRAHIPYDPDISQSEHVYIEGLPWRGAKGRNGLAPRTDIMARLMARGVTAGVAYRAAYRASGDPIRDAQRAWDVSRHAKFKNAVQRYREILQGECKQQAQGMRDFVLGRLTHEAQTAPESAARIKALDLLGKSEGMWTTVHRSEKAMTPKDLEQLKSQLYQRLRNAMATLSGRGQAMVDGLQSHDTGSADGIQVPPNPTLPAPPLLSAGSIPRPAIPSLSNDPIPHLATPLSPSGLPPVHGGGTSPRQMVADDIGIKED